MSDRLALLSASASAIAAIAAAWTAIATSRYVRATRHLVNLQEQGLRVQLSEAERVRIADLSAALTVQAMWDDESSPTSYLLMENTGQAPAREVELRLVSLDHQFEEGGRTMRYDRVYPGKALRFNLDGKLRRGAPVDVTLRWVDDVGAKEQGPMEIRIR